MTHVLVGVDGSEHSRRALLRAHDEATLRDAVLEVVFVFPPPRRTLAEDLIGLPYGRGVGMGPISPDEPAHHPPGRLEEAEDSAMSRLEAFVADVLADRKGAVPRLTVAPGDHPAEVLIERSKTVDLLVIGTRGLGGFTGMLVGSVAHQCIQHARCAMLILPPAD